MLDNVLAATKGAGTSSLQWLVEPRPDSARTRISVAAEMLPQHPHAMVSLVQEVSLRRERGPECILAWPEINY